MKSRHVVFLFFWVGLVWTTPAQADAVTYWNEVTAQAVTAERPGGHGFLDVALVQAAVHDAIQAIERRYEPYHVRIQGTGSPDAAAGAAAYGVLVGIYPKQRELLDRKYKEFLTSSRLEGDPGLAVGAQVASAMLTQHRAVVARPDFNGATTPGAWRPTPSLIGPSPLPAPFASMAAVYMAEAKPFTLDSPSQFRPGPPPSLTSAEYTRDYNEVKRLGGRVSERTAAQTDLALFWGGNYITQWNGALRAIVAARPTDIGSHARLFALANLATADALIACWDSKKHFNFWRPITAIREGERDDNPQTAADPAWEPLINTPNYPDYTSGANNVTGAMTTILERFFGTDTFTFTVTSDVPGVAQKARSYSRFSDAASEVVNARILLGIHFRFADEVARTQGTNVANWTFSRYLRPLPAR